jgi:hypothetical protein
MFENVTWPIACVYHVPIESGGTKIKGVAEVEVIKGPANKLLDRRNKRHKQPFIDYAVEAADRVSSSG